MTSLVADSQLYGLRGSWRGPLSKSVTLTLGLDAQVLRSTLRRQGSVTLPAREGDPRVFGQLPPDEVNFDTWTTLVAQRRALRGAGRLACGATGCTSSRGCASSRS